jgi:H+/Cl- antiporter ClcA
MEQPEASPSRSDSKGSEGTLERSETTATENKMSRVWIIFFIALVAIFFTIPYLAFWTSLTDLVWENEFVLNNHWSVPVLVVVISIFVGLCVKYLKAETALRGSISESVESGADEMEYKKFPGSLISSYLSLISGASIGPEVALGALVREITSWFQLKLKLRPRRTLSRARLCI